MDVLLLSPWFPSPPFGGALIRVFETVRHLARRHRVTLLAPVDRIPEASDRAAIEGLGVEVFPVQVHEGSAAVAGRLAAGFVRGMPFIQGLHYDRALATELRNLTTERRFEIVHVEHSFMAPYLDQLSAAGRMKTVLSMHNIESLRFRRELQVMPWGPRRIALAADGAVFGSWEPQAVGRFDAVAVVSPEEQAWVGEHAPRAMVALVPNGVDADRFTPSPIPPGSRSVVFPGLMNYPPNADAVSWFCDAVLPLVARKYPDVRFVIVGDKPTAAVRRLAQRPGVEVTGRVADVRPYIQASAAVVVPLRSGAGTRLKILEAMAMRRPVVSTRLGAEGLVLAEGANVLIGDTPEAFAEHVSTLLGNPLVADRLGRAGRRLVETTYDWPLCFRPLDELYGALSATPAAGRRIPSEAVN